MRSKHQSFHHILSIALEPLIQHSKKLNKILHPEAGEAKVYESAST
jgi:hypothetical protein